MTGTGVRRATVLAVVGLLLISASGAATAAAAAASAPDASFDYSPSSPNPDDKITFDASASSDPDGRIVDYDWYVGGGSYADGSGETFSKTFDTGGSYTVTLEVEDDEGNVDRYSETVTVENPAPDAEISYSPASPDPDDTISFDASGSSDADGRIVDYDWYVGTDSYSDGSGENFETSFGTAGTYEVSLTVEDNGGKTDTVSKTITVENDEPEAAFEYSPANPNPDDEIGFDASDSEDDDGRIVDYDWYVGTDDYADGSGQSFSHAFGEAGVYDVRLVVTDNGEATTAVTKKVNVTNPAPEPTFTTRSSPDGLDVTFDASDSTDPDGRIVDYDWYVGTDSYSDGSGQTYTHAFDEKGSYEVRLSVTDNGGVTREVTKTVGVSQRPTASIDYAGEALPVDRTVTLSAAGSTDPDGNLTAYEWDLPDGTTKRGETVTMSVNETGEHTLNLTVTDETGNSHTVSETVVAKEPPSVNVSWSPETPRDDLDVAFDVSASTAVESAAWDFDGDGEFDDGTGETAVHAFDDTGKKRVSVRVVSADGVATTHAEVLSVQQSAAFELNSVKTNITEGETAVVTFSVSNLVRDTPMDAKLVLDLPDSGASIASVEGSSVVGSGETAFVTVEPGREEQIRVRVQFTDPGEYDIGGRAVYYFDGDDAPTDRRTSAVEPITVVATEETDALDGVPNPASDTELPGFGAAEAVGALLAVLAAVAARRR